MRRLAIILACATAFPVLLTVAPAQASTIPPNPPPNLTSTVLCSGTRQPPSAFHPATDQLPGPGFGCGKGFQFAVTPTHGTTATYNYPHLKLTGLNQLEAYVPRGSATAKVDYKIFDCNGGLLWQSVTFDQNVREGWYTVPLNNVSAFGATCIGKVVLESGMVSAGFDMAMDAIGFTRVSS